MCLRKSALVLEVVGLSCARRDIEQPRSSVWPACLGSRGRGAIQIHFHTAAPPSPRRTIDMPPRRRLAVLVLLAACMAPATPAAADSSVPGDTSAAPALGSCRSPEWRAARRAVMAWCDGEAPVARRYDDWSLARTRRRACADLRAAFAQECEVRIEDGGFHGEDGLMVVVDYPDGAATYWYAMLERHGRAFRVTRMNFEEDCTGP